jgi:hypothetical protein
MGEVGMARLSSLHLISVQEMNQLRQALSKGMTPPDLESKLNRLAGSRLGQQFIERNSRLFVALLRAAGEGTFRGATVPQREQLLRVLAYVRKDDDAVPDPRPDGFTDDLIEVRKVVRELAPLLAQFKDWRLEHQVPAIWSGRFEALHRC